MKKLSDRKLQELKEEASTQTRVSLPGSDLEKIIDELRELRFRMAGLEK